MTRNRIVPALVLAVGLLAVACSSNSSATRSASVGTYDTAGFSLPQGDPDTPVDANAWCLRAQDDDGASGFAYVRNIVGCNVMTNTTRKFTAPGKLDGKFPLGVTKALCSQDDYTCRNEGGSYYGEVRTEGASAGNVTVKGDRYTMPNPFTQTAAIQFMPKKIWQGVTTRTYVGSNVAPYNLTSQVLAELWFNIPTAGSNEGNCVQGQFITCRLDGGMPQGSQERINWTLGNLPLQIQINNNSGRSMQAQSDPIAGAGFLVDEVGTSSAAQLKTIASGMSVYVGGYRSANSDDEQSWTANYVITSLSGDVPVSITIKMAKVDNKWVNQSQCTVSNRTATTTFKCNTPTLNDSDAYRQATVTITDF